MDPKKQEAEQCFATGACKHPCRPKITFICYSLVFPYLFLQETSGLGFDNKSTLVKVFSIINKDHDHPYLKPAIIVLVLAKFKSQKL